MAPAAINLESQTLELERIRARCVSARDAVNSVRQRLAEVTDQESDLTAAIQSRHESEIRMQMERVSLTVRDRMIQNEHDLNSGREAISRSRERKLSELAAAFKEDSAIIRQKLQSELWVLQSVCDESNEDTPVREAERA